MNKSTIILLLIILLVFIIGWIFNNPEWAVYVILTILAVHFIAIRKKKKSN